MSATMSATGFRAGSVESMKALQVEHRYEGQASAALQAACIPAGLGRRNLAHSVEAQMASRSDEQLHRELHGRRSGAALEWLLKRQQERTQTEAPRPRARGAGDMHRTSPDNPLFIQTNFTQPGAHSAPSPIPTPAQMAAALAQLAIDPAASNATISTQTSGDTLAAAAAAVPPVVNITPCADSNAAAAGGAADQHTFEEGDDAVAVIADGPEGPFPPHLASHLQTSSLSPKSAGPEALAYPDSGVPLSPMHAAAQEAYWKQQELEDLVAGLLQEYPHGIPRRMVIDLRELGITDIPALGFGCPTSSLSFDSALLSK